MAKTDCYGANRFLIMKRFAPLLLLTLIFAVVATPIWAATNAKTSKSSGKSPGVGMATAVTTVTGVAISPLMGTGAYGAYQWAAAKKNGTPVEDLPWYAQMSFWGPALGIVVLVGAKD